MIYCVAPKTKTHNHTHTIDLVISITQNTTKSECVREEKDKVTEKMLYSAIDNVILGPEKKTFRLTDNERKIVAFHESGHAFLHIF